MSSSEVPAKPAATSVNGWRKTAVTIATIAALTVLAFKYPQYAGEAIVGFLGLVGIHSQTVS